MTTISRTIFAGCLAAAIAGCGTTGPTAAPTPDLHPPIKSGPKPYADIVTKEAASDTGLFITHRTGDKLLFEIPSRELGKDFLLVSTEAKAQSGVGYGGDLANQQVVRWEREGNRVLLRSVLFASVAADTLPVAYAVRKANVPPIIMAFDVQAFNRDSTAVVIDASDLFTTDVPELGLDRRVRERFKIRRLDSKRSFITRVKAFPDNIETEATLTYDAGEVPIDASLSAITVVMHHSMVRLPEQPMKPRLWDERVGFFFESLVDYGYDSQRAEQRRYIARWRLEPKDTAAFLRGLATEPVKPIVFYIDRGVPGTWRPWLKKGVEDWQPAFEHAGFKNAIIARDAPSIADDPEWSPEDARHSTIRWLPSEIENAYGPHISDPRSGEILDADIGFFHNVMNLARDWYFVQAGCLDPRAATLPLPDSLMGEILEYITAHEVGHSLGFPHNMKASSAFPVDSLRSASFTAQYGDEASIMDYGRFNYVAQPGDGARLIPKIGPYDFFAVEWGYRPIPGAATPDDERTALNAIAARQEREPYLRFGSADGIDPTAQTEDLGDDAIAATRYGLKNINRVAAMLLSATTAAGKDYATLREMYDALWTQRTRELIHVANLPGGVVRTGRVAGEPGPVYTPVTAGRQRDAVAFLLREAFHVPPSIVRPEILALIEPTGIAERVLQGQRMILTNLFDNGRLGRMVTQQALATDPAAVYGLSRLFPDLQNGIWSELSESAVRADVFRRNLQRLYIEILGEKINAPPPLPPPPVTPGQPPGAPPAALPGDARALMRSGLMELDAAIARALPRASDRETRAHLMDSRHQIERILHPETK